MEKVSITISGKKFEHWTSIEIEQSIDTFDTVRFSAPFKPTSTAFRATFEPFTFKPVTVRIGDVLRFTGTMVGVHPRVDASGNFVDVTAYSRPGVLCDCTAHTGEGYVGRRPKGAIKTQFEKLSLLVIAQMLCDPFDITCGADDEDVGPVFDRVSIGFEEKIHDFLVKLAKQRGFVIRNTPGGQILFEGSLPDGVVGIPIVSFVEGVPPLTKVTASFSPQNYYSQITGYAPARRGKPGGVYTLRNPWLGKNLEIGAPINEMRPCSRKFDDTDRADLPAAAKAMMGRMFGEAVSYSIEDVPTWRDPKQELWEPNLPMSLTAPSVMVYNKTDLYIRTVTLKQTPESETASFDLVLPEAFKSGGIPKRLPWHDQSDGLGF